MRILIVVPGQDQVSGNWVTARRFQHGLETCGHQVVVEETPLQPESSFKEKILVFSPDVAILLHAYRSGKPWLEATRNSPVPYVVLLTGTDVNSGLEDPVQSTIIRECIHHATFALLQNPLIAKELSSIHPELTENLYVLPPGIILGRTPYKLREEHKLAKDKPLFLCPAGLRPIKGGLQLLEMFDLVVAESPDCQIAFCGPLLDKNYSERFLNALKNRPWARYLGAIPTQAMASAMHEADIILNNSDTEGLANALLEAATIGIPILARKIPGNSAVVEHAKNGLLYSNQKEFLSCCLQLLDKEYRQKLSNPDPNRYNPEQETISLNTILLKTVE